MAMKKILVLLSILLVLAACAPQEPVKPVVDVSNAVAQMGVQSPKVDVAPEIEIPEVKAEVKTAPKTFDVEIKGFAYNPATVTVKVGDTVTWTQMDGSMHTVTTVSGPESFDSGLLKQGESFKYTFTKPGTYEYKCTPHPKMRGKVVVE